MPYLLRTRVNHSCIGCEKGNLLQRHQERFQLLRSLGEMLQVDHGLRNLGQVVHLAQPITYILANVTDKQSIERLTACAISECQLDQHLKRLTLRSNSSIFLCLWVTPSTKW